jgi:hypothetical protein
MTKTTATQRRRAAQLAQALGQIGFVLPGTLLERRTRCGKPNCRCKSDPPTLHGPYYQWTRKVDGRTVTRLLTAEQLVRYRDWFANAQRARQLLAELETLSITIADHNEGWTTPRSTENPDWG